MKSLPLLALAAGAAMALANSPAFAGHRLTSSICQPLTPQNIQSCCAAVNRMDIILPSDMHFCDRADRIRESLASLGDVDTPEPPGCTGDCGPPTPGPDTSLGNPGNDKPVGRAGEMEDKGMIGNANDSIGVRGASDLHH